MNQSQPRAAARILAGRIAGAEPSRMRAEVAFRMSSISACTSGTLPTLSISLR